ncbi:MAG: hypothetical protein E7425_06335 [Ruminococcaceae bacterium]|nr:hypothetical protein [Oscillospiraceae bacterium]
MKDTQKPVAEEVAEKVETVVTEAAESVKPAAEKVEKAAKKAKDGVKKAAKSAQKKAVETAEKAKTGVKRAADKAVKGEAAPVVYVQYQGAEEKVEDLVAAAKAAFAAEHSHTKVSDLKLYIKPEERAAYYVVNEKFAGRVDF